MSLRTLFVVATCLLGWRVEAQDLLYPLTNRVYFQSFDWTDIARVGVGSYLIDGWRFSETLANANQEYSTSDGRHAFAATFSYGPQGQYHNERALGMLRDANLASKIGVRFENKLGYVITEMTISYTGEQWRLGNRTGTGADRLDFAYKIGGGTLEDGVWIDVDPLDFLSPVTSGQAGAVDGNAAANRTFLSYQITGLYIADGDIFWLRWSDYDNPFGNDGLAVDDFTLIVPEPSVWALAGVMVGGWLMIRKRSQSGRPPQATSGSRPMP